VYPWISKTPDLPVLDVVERQRFSRDLDAPTIEDIASAKQ
jgi:hypothetical protein